MFKVATRTALCAAVLLSAACDRLGFGPHSAASAPSDAASPARPVLQDLRAHAGETYAGFVAGAGEAYAPGALGLDASDRARLWRAMATGADGKLLMGGGAEALVFRGCAETGCGDGEAVVAVDIGTGGAFVGVEDAGGAVIMAPNERVEALLRLNSPTRHWTGFDIPEAPAPASARP